MKFGLPLGFIAAGALVTACSVPTVGTGGAGGTTTVTAVSSSNNGVTSSGSQTPTSTATGDGPLCFAPTTAMDCATDCTTEGTCHDADGTGAQECCEKVVPNGEEAVNTVIIQGCACDAGSDCNSVCNGPTDICADHTATPTPDCAACLMQLNNQSACIPSVKTACAADANNCEAYVICLAGCPTN